MKFASIGLQAVYRLGRIISTKLLPQFSENGGSARLADQTNAFDGFSLFEMLMALAILAIALVALLQAQSNAIRTTVTAVKSGNARIVAESVMARTLNASTVGAVRGSSGRNGAYIWTVDLVKVDAGWARPATPQKWRLFEIIVTVRWEKDAALTLRTLKLIRA